MRVPVSPARSASGNSARLLVHALPHAFHREAERLLALENVHQKHHALVAIVGHENCFQLRERSFDDTNALARLQIGHLQRIVREPLSDRFDDFVLDRHRVFIEPNDVTDTARGAYRIPVIVDVVELDEKIPGEKRFPSFKFASVVQLLDTQLGQVARKTLPRKILECTIFLPGFALDDVPTRTACGHRYGVVRPANLRPTY